MRVFPSYIVIISIVIGFVAPAIAADSSTDRLTPYVNDQSSITNPTGAAVYYRQALDHALEMAVREAAKDIAPSSEAKPCVESKRCLLVTDPAAVTAAMAMRDAAKMQLESIIVRLDELNHAAVDLLKVAQTGKPAPAEVLSFTGIGDFGDAVRDVVDTARFVTSLFSTQYTFSKSEAVPTPGLVEATLLLSLGDFAYQFGEPVRTTSTIGEMFYKARASEINVGALLIEIAKLNLNPENKAKFDRLSSDHNQLDDALDRWEAPGEKNTPSALDRLIEVDFKLPDDFIMLTLRSSSDVMSVQPMGILPKRTFDIDAAATVVVSAIDPNAKVTRVIGRGAYRLKVDPRKSVNENLEPPKEQGSQKCTKPSSDSNS